MIRTGEQYRESLRDGREVYMDGQRVEDVTTHPKFKPMIDIRSRIYDLQHDKASQPTMTFERDGELFPVGNQIPREEAHWHAKRKAVDTVLRDIGGVVTRVGDETVGEMWSL